MPPSAHSTFPSPDPASWQSASLANVSCGFANHDEAWRYGPILVTASSAIAKSAMRINESSIALMFSLGSSHLSRPGAGDLPVHDRNIVVCRNDYAHAIKELNSSTTVWVLVAAWHFERRWTALLPNRELSKHSGDGALATLARNSIETLWRCRADFSSEDLLAGFEAALDMLDQSLRLRRLAHRSKQELYEQVLGFIARELENMALDPSWIARRHGCSLRALQALFAEHGATVAGTIRHQRLERCMAELRNGRAERIGQVAQQWGFPDAAHFSKLFKATFGVSPSEFRRKEMHSSRGSSAN